MLKSILMLGLAAAALAPFAARAQAGAGTIGGFEDTRVKEARLQAQILERIAEGSLDNRHARRLMRDLEQIRRIDSFYRSPQGEGAQGGMTAEQRADIIARLDLLRGGLYAEVAQGPQPRRR